MKGTLGQESLQFLHKEAGQGMFCTNYIRFSVGVQVKWEYDQSNSNLMHILSNHVSSVSSRPKRLNTIQKKGSFNHSRDPIELLLPVDLDSRSAFRSPFTQCLMIQGCFCTSSSGMRFSGSNTKSYRRISTGFMCNGYHYLLV